jgi:hypothetical protein
MARSDAAIHPLWILFSAVDACTGLASSGESLRHSLPRSIFGTITRFFAVLPLIVPFLEYCLAAMLFYRYFKYQTEGEGRESCLNSSLFKCENGSLLKLSGYRPFFSPTGFAGIELKPNLRWQPFIRIPLPLLCHAALRRYPYFP